MTNADFNIWLDAHSKAFGSIRSWLRRNADCAESWKQCLSDVELDDALEATRLMNLGDEGAPNGFGDHARFVRKIARRLAYDRASMDRKDDRDQYVDGQRVADCADCFDTGWVEVVNIWRTKSGGAPIKPFLDGKTNHLPTCAVACTCHSAPRVRKESPRFDPSKMFKADLSETTEQAAERFREWWNRAEYLGTRVKIFDQHNSGALAYSNNSG